MLDVGSSVHFGYAKSKGLSLFIFVLIWAPIVNKEDSSPLDCLEGESLPVIAFHHYLLTALLPIRRLRSLCSQVQDTSPGHPDVAQVKYLPNIQSPILNMQFIFFFFY